MPHQCQGNPVQIAGCTEDGGIRERLSLLLRIFPAEIPQLRQAAQAAPRGAQCPRQDEFFLRACHRNIEDTHLLRDRLAADHLFDASPTQRIIFLSPDFRVLIYAHADSRMCMIEHVS